MVKNELVLAPSILCADNSTLAESVNLIKQSGLKWVHLDIMDGHFVPNLSFGPALIKDLRGKFKDMFFDTHLMLSKPNLYIENFADAGADLITVHVEPAYPIAETLQQIHLAGKKVGICVNAGTPVGDLLDFLPLVDLVLIMSVRAGFGGQSFIEESYEKIKKVNEFRNNMKLNFRIEVDGGINANNLSKVVGAGADTIVAGSAFFNDGQNLLGALNLLK